MALGLGALGHLRFKLIIQFRINKYLLFFLINFTGGLFFIINSITYCRLIIALCTYIRIFQQYFHFPYTRKRYNTRTCGFFMFSTRGFKKLSTIHTKLIHVLYTQVYILLNKNNIYRSIIEWHNFMIIHMLGSKVSEF